MVFDSANPLLGNVSYPTVYISWRRYLCSNNGHCNIGFSIRIMIIPHTQFLHHSMGYADDGAERSLLKRLFSLWLWLQQCSLWLLWSWWRYASPGIHLGCWGPLSPNLTLGATVLLDWPLIPRMWVNMMIPIFLSILI